MPIVKVDGLPEGYELLKDFKGHKFALVFKDNLDIRLVKDWKEAPLPEEVLIAVDREKKK
jgi:hypothetical protein